MSGTDGVPSPLAPAPDSRRQESAASGGSTAAAVVVAAGLGSRLGAPAKALLLLAGRPALAWSLDALEAAEEIASVVVVAGGHTREAIETLLADGAWPKARTVVLGGERRQDSVLAGLLAGDPAADVVAVHDAARPLATAALFDACVRAAREHGAAIAAAPVSDTLKRAADGRVEATVDRAGLWAAQTPQAVRRDLLLEAFARAAADGRAVTDEASLCEALGIPVAIVPAGADNLKVTHPADIAVADALLRVRVAAREGASGVTPGVGGERPDASAAERTAPAPALSSPFGIGGEPPGDRAPERASSPGSDHPAASPESLPPAGSPAPSGAAGFPAREASTESTVGAPPAVSATAAPDADRREGPRADAIRPPENLAVPAASRAPRTGIGYDVHRFAPGRRLVLGGVEIAHPEGLGLEGHSDADVLLHAVCDALLGAAGLGDIGHFFPPGDPRFAGADSRDLLRESARLVRAAGFLPANVDASLVAEAPRIGPHVPAMRAAIAACLGLDPSAVGVKATTNEGMGFVGRGEGIAALAVATVVPT